MVLSRHGLADATRSSRSVSNRVGNPQRPLELAVSSFNGPGHDDLPTRLRPASPPSSKTAPRRHPRRDAWTGSADLTAHLMQTVTELGERGIGFASLTEAIDTVAAAGRLLFHVLASLARLRKVASVRIRKT